MSNFFCPLPWIHQFIQADGIKMCCSSKTKLTLTPIEFANSEYIKTVKEQFKEGIIPNDCIGCKNKEQQGYTSTRNLALNDWNYTINSVPEKIEYLDLRWSNLCNYSCRTCEPTFSSEIAREISSNPMLKKYYYVNNDIRITNNIDISDLLPSIKRINFTGGEPLLIKENIYVLEQLILLDNTNCEILITTNGSVINPNLLSLVKQFSNVHWTVSIDAVKTQAEYIRNGTNWEQLCRNLHDILSLKHSVGINCVLSSYSILGLSQLVKFFNNLKTQYCDQPLELWFDMCEYPKFLNPANLSIVFKDWALNEIFQAIELLRSVDNNPDRSLDTLISLYNNLNDAELTENEQFITYTNELDLIRNQNFNAVFNLK
jgi:uncharacterized Fe-S cluster-containing radical SAM superfamily protein